MRGSGALTFNDYNEDRMGTRLQRGDRAEVCNTMLLPPTYVDERQIKLIKSGFGHPPTRKNPIYEKMPAGTSAQRGDCRNRQKETQHINNR